jgi:uncharacterized membrane protein
MDKKFSEQEKKYLKSVTKWNERASKQQVFFYNICMVVGAVIVLFTCLYIIQNVDEKNIYLKGLPGFIVSIPFFLIYYFGLKAIDEKNLIASIFEKLKRRDSK